MSRKHITTAITIASAALCGASLIQVATATDAQAQGMPGAGGQPGGMPTPAGSGSSEGVAEQAPKKLGALPTTPVLPPAKGSRKKLQVFSLDGYFRFRHDWLKQMDLGFTDVESLGGAPFPNALACRGTSSPGDCKNSYSSANARLRLEPIFHIDERSSVHMQIDVFDNLVLGSTPLGYAADGGSSDLPIDAIDGNQQAPQAGLNNLGDSIVVKRAWAEIDAPIGLLKFGRMPWHWGMGMVANGGGRDPIHGGYNLDADSGDTVDRVSFSAKIPGMKLNAGIAMDWSQTGAHSATTGEQRGVARQAWDLDDSDDLGQWLLMISNLDSPTRNTDKLANGEAVFNYGAFLAYKTQDNVQQALTIGETPPAESFVARDMTTYVPDVWVKYAKGKFDVEAEATYVVGSLKAPDLGIAETVDIRQFGGVARMNYRLMEDDLTLTQEVGFASGDQWDNEVQGRTHVSGAVGLGPGDNTLEQFVFDPNYHVDLILFRELLGAVSNAAYSKTSFKYALTSKFAVRGSGILSAAHRPVATPGNSTLYGFELDADIGYENNGFFAGISYGILLPFAALDHPTDAAFPFGGSTSNGGGASIAQTIQSRLVLQF
ncbi:MAG: TIGR04551 family protein [Myxococcales bacterium]|nr:TIGR04551 family protein [Myxococcales bacterium]